MGKKTSIIIVSVIAIAVFIILQRYPTDSLDSIDIRKPQIRRYVDFSITFQLGYGTWYSSQEDIPYYSQTVNAVVRNVGNMNADNVYIRAEFSGDEIYSSTVDIPAGAVYSLNLVDIDIKYDSSGTLSLSASCDEESEYSTYTISAVFPRYEDVDILRLYITPDHPKVIALRNQIVQNSLIHWKSIRDWVGNNIKYEYDSNQFGKTEYWLLPWETIEKGQGDCEDQAILLCSLLRADGWDSDEVYVVCGLVNNGEAGHAWVCLKLTELLGKELWINLEPTAGGIIDSEFSDLYSIINELSGSTIRQLRFNDINFKSFE